MIETDDENNNFKWVLESSDTEIFGDTGKHFAGQETALRDQMLLEKA